MINNGAAGMPNFTGSTFGLVTRIAISPSPHRPLYGLIRDGVHIDALPLHYDQRAFLDRFLARWPQDSPAHASYFERIVCGPDYALAPRWGSIAPRCRVLSIIIPVLDEAAGIAAALRRGAVRARGAEVIVVDGGSRDGTRSSPRRSPIA